jgi:hypothetical protein
MRRKTAAFAYDGVLDFVKAAAGGAGPEAKATDAAAR